ncbi:hypothetical protein NIES4074_04850 [Cylindrospermum sp. NIES-4074]|nr:hypothetical protein NIES4074_04850 [Cylindrospermum sp. NIES-4074]
MPLLRALVLTVLLLIPENITEKIPYDTNGVNYSTVILQKNIGKLKVSTAGFFNPNIITEKFP